jgi:DNA polymerase III beta subunit, central domain
MTEQATLSLHVLRAFASIVNEDPIRYCLNSVFVEIATDQVIYVATDGHRLLARREASKPANTLLGNFIIPREVCLRRPAEYEEMDDEGEPRVDEPRKGELRRFDKIRLVLFEGDTGTIFKPIDGKYPDWRKVVPREKCSGKMCVFEPEYVADFIKLSRLLNLGVPSFSLNGTDPTLVQFSDEEHTLGMLMPYRDARALSGVAPAWVHAR